MNQNEFNGMAIIWMGCFLAVLLGLWKFFKAFPTQRDFDNLQERVDELVGKQQRSEVLIARLDITICNLERAVRDLTTFLRGDRQGPTCVVPLPYHPTMEDKNED